MPTQLPFNLIEDVVFEKLRSDCELNDFTNPEYLQNADFGSELIKYCLLNFYPEKFYGDKSILYYNKYYWFLRFRHKFNEVNGYDAGIDQQAFKILEESETIPGLDVRIMQAIKENATEKDS